MNKADMSKTADKTKAGKSLISESAGRQLGRAAWLALVLWQFAWIALLPQPYGKHNLILATIIAIPMLLPLLAILKLQPRGLIWAGYLTLFLAMFGFMEFWADPPERPAAALQLLLCGLFFTGLVFGTRKRR